jgi:Glyoxalase/Bleomycin resistance protein/Dioxygenase superfamily
VSATDSPTWLGPVRQTAFVVDDIEAAAWEWVRTHGVGPWFLYEVDIPGTTYRTQTVPMRARMGLAQTGGQQIELIQPDPAVPSIYTEFVERGGTGVHHVCYWADLDRAVDHFAAAGSPVVQRGLTATGAGFVYVEGSCGLPYVELVDPQGQMKAFFDLIAAAADGWDGTDPVRGRR